jgi:adenylate cyclase
LITTEATFVFADIAGFTALTEAHGDEDAATLAAAFCAAVRAEVPSDIGAQGKTIGDAVMLRIDKPADAILLGLTLVDGLMNDHGAPAVRVGLHYGSAIEQDGDYFGASVNLAARVSELAAGGEVLVTGSTAARVPELEGVFYESRGRRELKNIREAVEILAARHVNSVSQGQLQIDPVCRMAVDPDRAAGRLTHNGVAYFFCSLSCAGGFAMHPERFASKEPSIP